MVEPNLSEANCLNCGAPMLPEATYCASCGQKRVRRIKSLHELLGDIVVSVFNLESQTWQTLWQLLIPGKLTESYFQGKRANLLTPLRIFLLMAVAHFAILAIRIGEVSKVELERVTRQQREGAYEKRYTKRLDSLSAIVKTDFPRASEALDTLQAQMTQKRSLIFETNFGFLTYKNDTFGIKAIPIAAEDYMMLSGDELAKKYEVADPLTRAQLNIYQRISQDPDNFVQFILSKLVWMAVVLIPALALFLKLLYIRRNRYFVEHLVFALHYHAFAYAFMGLFFLVSFHNPQFLGFAFIGILLYGYLAMKRYYGQGIVKTFLKFSVLHFTYVVLVGLAQVLIVLISAYLYGNT